MKKLIGLGVLLAILTVSNNCTKVQHQVAILVQMKYGWRVWHLIRLVKQLLQVPQLPGQIKMVLPIM